jgi:hypothetical protein
MGCMCFRFSKLCVNYGLHFTNIVLYVFGCDQVLSFIDFWVAEFHDYELFSFLL